MSVRDPSGSSKPTAMPRTSGAKSGEPGSPEPFERRTRAGTACPCMCAARDRWFGAGGAALPAGWILAVLCLASATTLVVLGSKLTFFNDEWYLLLQRPGLSADAILEPLNEHVVA